ncbi:hypothetical protein K1T71_013655 [Dendrolimus kikuchii]|uniref:Uncharacterized protein n=1 Tax=Dendrolimus kikuchii TaxID=765133 RepID=A0ACC1CH23_9NEOP|nr:hypothetical protein K1T71_013655 [Dendrolimus kikuchii]
MTAYGFVIALLLVEGVRGAVDINCSDNATCIDGIAKEIVTNLREQKAVKIFDLMTIEPLAARQGRSNEGLLTKFIGNHAFSFDFGGFTFRLAQPRDGSDVVKLEVFEERATKDNSEDSPKKPISKTDDDSEEDSSKAKIGLIKRRHKKKVLQALLPMLVGMKSAGAVIFAFTLVSVLTIKAFVVSKLALLLTLGLAIKKLYETWGNGVGIPNNPYLYSQYPIDFPSATSHAYSVSGVSQQFASPDVYSPTALGTHTHQHEIMQPSDATAQQSQQAPTLQLVNNTRATERWDGYRRRPMFYGTSRATSESYSGYQYHQ